MLKAGAPMTIVPVIPAPTPIRSRMKTDKAFFFKKKIQDPY